MNSSFHIAVFGIGAMGCLFGSRLRRLPAAPDGRPLAVHLVGHWPAQIEALRSRGLLIRNLDGDVEQMPLPATDDPAALPPADLALMLVKSWQTAQIAPAVAKILRPEGLALTLQNGLGNAEALATALPARHIAVGITAQGANLAGPGRLHIGGSGPTVLAEKKESAERLQMVAAIFNQCGLSTELRADAGPLIWEKLAINAAINPLTALLNVPNGRLAEMPEPVDTMRRVIQEVRAVAEARGIFLDVATLWQRTLEVCRATATNISSMLQDIRNGRPTEIDAICGAIMQLGEKLNIPTPVNRLLWHAIKKRETRKTNNNPKDLSSAIQGAHGKAGSTKTGACS